MIRADKSRKRRRGWGWKLGFPLAILLLIGISYYAYSFIHFGQQIQKKHEQTAGEEQQPEAYSLPEWEGEEQLNILLLGGDGRLDEDPGRSDTIMVASIDPVRKTVHLFSILRDTYVEIPGRGMNRINTALAFGGKEGPELASKVVGDLLGIPIHNYVFIDFESFIKLIDAIGGVDFYVEKDMKYTDTADNPHYQIDLKEGMQHLDGNKALQYVRFRNDALSDYARTERQREFLKAVAKKMKNVATLMNLPQILNQIAPYVETNMDSRTMLKLAGLCYQIKQDSIHSYQLPPLDMLREEKIKGASVITVDQSHLQDYMEVLLSSNSAAAE
ncbi:LCP family protein [Paenibacillus bouchesdurhonensis]|uniref:LCP family protein n=1 Tax=Paenibacillus bouchesdurhonensis TaxID=1870990 RepID=UPI000DA61E11|nr:LCP family protein [Paenibacillus bouchesdurhonensis]